MVSNIRITHYVNSVTFTQKLLVQGAGPENTEAFEKLGGTFQCYLDIGGRGWLFPMNKEQALKEYLNSGNITKVKEGRDSILDFCPGGQETLEKGECKECKKKYTLGTAIKEYTAFYAGLLPRKAAYSLISKEYEKKIGVLFANGEYMCVKCIEKEN